MNCSLKYTDRFAFGFSLLMLTVFGWQQTSGADVDNPVRIATYNVSMYRNAAGQLVKELVGGKDTKTHQVAEIIQTVRPDILLLNEFDFDRDRAAIRSFQSKYLGVPHGSAAAIEYPFLFVRAVNTGVPSGIDFDNNGKPDDWNDSFGFGRHPGQYGMVVLSKFPIKESECRTFQKMLWTSMPGAHLPKDPETGESFYSSEALKVFRLSSKSHWDVVIDVRGQSLHFLTSHPTPPVFDGPEDRNGKRNHDEIRLFADYVSPDRSQYIVDDAGKQGGLAAGSRFVIAGDLNADPHDGGSFQQAIRQLTQHPLVRSKPVPTSEGSVEFAGNGANAQHRGNPANDTADFDDRRTGNLRADYVLPSKTLKVVDAGVFWPKQGTEHYGLIGASDHRLVWVDVQFD